LPLTQEHCQDDVPKTYCKLLAIDPGSTYSDAVAWLRFRDTRQQLRGEECVYPHRDEEDECDEEKEA
jgi:hypothetical protein